MPGSKSPAAALLRLIQANSGDPSILRRAAATAGVASISTAGAAARGNKGRTDAQSSRLADAQPLNFENWSRWITSLDGTFEAAATAAAVGKNEAGDEGTGAKLPEPARGPVSAATLRTARRVASQTAAIQGAAKRLSDSALFSAGATHAAVPHAAVSDDGHRHPPTP